VCLGIDPEYFWDEMTWREFNALQKYYNNKNREDWERLRLIGYWIIQSQSTKALTPQDIIRFEWEKEEELTGEEIREIAINELERVKPLFNGKEIQFNN